MGHYALHSSDCYCIIGVRIDKDDFLNKYRDLINRLFENYCSGYNDIEQYMDCFFYIVEDMNKEFKAEGKELIAKFGNYEFGTQVEVIIGFDIEVLERINVSLEDTKNYIFECLKVAGFDCEREDIKIEVGFECWHSAEYD